jgi:4'-phosphopantetheinyl transferase
MIAALQPRDGEVHMYRILLPHLPPELSRLEQLLSASETTRAANFRSDHAKMRFIAGRGVLREILGGYLGIAPGKVQIASAEHGKPYLVEAEKLRFNLSHSGDVLLLAVSTGLEVGVDIEAMDPDKPLLDMARLALSPREQEVLLSLPSADLRTAAFYRFWVRREACLKACGRGFSNPGDDFDVSSEEAPLPAVRCNRAYWHVLDIDVPQPYCAALAVETRTPSLPPPKLVWVAQER